MKTIRIALAVCAAALSGHAALAADSATWTQSVLTPEAALKAATAAQAECRRLGWQITVAVTDPVGLPLVLLRDRYAGWHTVDAATAKARTAASWRSETGTVAQHVLKPDSPEQAIVNLPGVLMMAGGLPVESAGHMVGAIGISGAPGAENDVQCARAGLAAIEGDLGF